MNSLTDLGGKKGAGKSGVKDFNIKNTQVCSSIFLSALYKYFVAVRIEGTFGQVTGDDAQLKDVANSTNGRYERNLRFKSAISEVLIAAEMYPFIIFRNSREENEPSTLQPYILAGIGYYHFNPQAKLNTNWIDLQPLHTEGEGFREYPDRKVYQLNQVNFPLGLGLKYEASSLFNFRLELAWRILKTDYLDDVSTKYIDPKYFSVYLSGTRLTEALLLNDRHLPGAETAHPDGIRGNPHNNDSYFNVNFKVSFCLNRRRI